MKGFIKKYGKTLALTVLAVVAGCSYSCKDQGQGELLSVIETGQGNGETVETAAESETETTLVGELAASKDPLLPASCFVHVCGEVRNPGVYELLEGQRVFHAIAMAGGFADQAAQDYLNQAELVWDGMKLLVPSKEQVSNPEWENLFWDRQNPDSMGVGPNGNHMGDSLGRTKTSQDHMVSSSGKVNLNTATKEELMTLRGIGEARAEDIIRYRQERGGFERIEDIMEISGIKDAAFQKIKDDIIV
ncbi:hypothetical protein D3Z58_15090 [Clostridiaceae bacterium]|nr:hypothetical protein [Clostridiaceae bacterium]